jgi:hypothetical protein
MAQRRGPTRPKEQASDPPPLDLVITLREKRDKLDQRLEDGFRKIAEGEAEGRDVASWEAFWMSLLREYEDVCKELTGMGSR